MVPDGDLNQFIKQFLRWKPAKGLGLVLVHVHLMTAGRFLANQDALWRSVAVRGSRG